MRIASSATTMGRAAAEKLMTDTCRISRPGAGTVFDPETGEYVDDPGAVVYEGRCEVKMTGIVPQSANVGEVMVALERVTLKIPWDAPPVPVNSTATITAIGPASGAHVGARYRVTGNHDRTHGTATRLPVELVST